MIICPNCNAQLNDDAQYCPYCGTQFIVKQEDNVGATTFLTSDMLSSYQTGQVLGQEADSQQMSQASVPYQQQDYSQQAWQSNTQNSSQDSWSSNNNIPNNQSSQVPGQMTSPSSGTETWQQPSQNPQYRQNAPAAQLKTNRGLLKTILLSLVTFGIYAIITYGGICDDVNLVCSRYDGRKSMNYYLLFFLIGPVTLGIGSIVWYHNICNRIGMELKRRQISYNFGAKDFWLWNVLGVLFIVGPLIFIHKLLKAVNQLNENYNQFG